jgi:3-keto-5-aminohexanoate cleavage enzyme
VAHEGTVLPEGTRNPLSPEEVAKETLRSFNAGAAIVHHHVRDDKGRLTSDLTHYRLTLDLVRAESDIILNVSTGGLSTLSLEERCVGLDEPRVEMASLNMGSINFGESVYINTLPDIRFWASRMRERDVVPELEIFDLAMIGVAEKLEQEGVLEAPLHYNICMGFPSTLSADGRHLATVSAMLPRGAEWGVAQAGMESLSLMACAFELGARVLRVGFEDGAFLRPGVPAGSNGELVEELVRLVHTLGGEIASPEEARELLGLRGQP